jgi:hypothetical protein
MLLTNAPNNQALLVLSVCLFGFSRIHNNAHTQLQQLQHAGREGSDQDKQEQLEQLVRNTADSQHTAAFMHMWCECGGMPSLTAVAVKLPCP